MQKKESMNMKTGHLKLCVRILREERMKRVTGAKELMGMIKGSNICIMGVTEETGKGTKYLVEEIQAKNVPILREEMDIQGQEIKRIPIGIILKGSC